MRRHSFQRSFFIRSFSAIISNRVSFAATVKLTIAALALMTGLSAVLATAYPVAADAGRIIPQDAIRIRIIANSDSAFDQRVKADVRDQAAAVIQSWGPMPATHDEARALIKSHLPEIRESAKRTLQQWAVAYGVHVELAEVPFPEKVFDQHRYPAGNYEALRITLGGGIGANWWCVMFPPLCLTAATAPGDAGLARAATEQSTGTQPKKTATGHTGAPKSAVKSAAKAHSPAAQATSPSEQTKPEARFFLWELLQRLGAFFQSLVS